MLPDIQELRERNPQLANAVLLDLGGKDGTDPMEKADAVLPNGERVALQTTADLRALLGSMPLAKDDERVRRLQSAAAMEREGNMLLGHERYDALMLLQRAHDSAVIRREKETARTIPIDIRSRVAAALSRAAAVFW